MRGVLVLGLALSLVACASPQPPVSSTTKVVKSFGTVQCEPSSVTLASVVQPLRDAGVRVVNATCGTDGMMRPAVCGAGDGRIAIVDIAGADLSKAASAGFVSISKAPDASAIACRTN